MKVFLLAHTYEPEKVVASAAKLCYSSSNIEDIKANISNDSAKEFVNMLSRIGHESPIEHASFTFGIEGISRSLLAQLTRHRIASFSVQSQRYVKENKFKFVVPPEIEKIEEAKMEFLEAMEEDQKHYNSLVKILKEKYINDLISNGVEKDKALKLAEKAAIEDARFVLPNACETKLVATFNARSLKNFFRLRCCNRAQWEIRELATAMLGLVVEVAPELFSNSGPSCVSKECSEGKMCCGKANEVRDKFNHLREK